MAKHALNGHDITSTRQHMRGTLNLSVNCRHDESHSRPLVSMLDLSSPCLRSWPSRTSSGKFENIPKGAAARNHQVPQKTVIQKNHDLVVFLNGWW